MANDAKFINAKSTKTGLTRDGAQWTTYVFEGENLSNFLEKVTEVYSAEKPVSICFFTTEKEGQFGNFLSTNVKIGPHEPKPFQKKATTFTKPKFVPKASSAAGATATAKRSPSDLE